jgi:bla regulator protein blaR1
MKIGEGRARMTFVQLLLAMTLASVTVGFILFIRRFLNSQLAPAWRYYLWFFLLGTLILPFLPLERISIKQPTSFTNTDKSDVGRVASSDTTETGWINDFGNSVTRIDVSNLDQLTNGLWIAGVAVSVLAVLFTQMRVIHLVKKAEVIKDEKVIELFQKCKMELKIRRQIKLKQSADVSAPFIFGLFRACVVLPTESGSSSKEMKYILLHELHHYKSRHVHWNYLFLLGGIIHWFNPFVRYALKEMRLDREIACDAAVLRYLTDEKEKTDYGRTLLHFAEKSRWSMVDQHTTSIRSTKQHLKKRLIHIMSGRLTAKRLHVKSQAIFTVLGLIVAFQVPAYAAVVTDEQYTIGRKNIAESNVSTYLKGDNSSFVLYSMKQDKYYIHNKKQSIKRVSPNSTYKIYSALTALEAGVMKPVSTDMEWDGSNYEYESWNESQDLQSAMQYSVTWYFQNVDRQVGKQTIKRMLSEYHYGNEDVSGKMEDFWLESTLKISPFEQVELLHDLYENKFNANPKNIEAVKASIKLEEKDGAVLYGKTGTGIVNGKAANGWFIGFVETKMDTYFFATNIRDGDATGSKAADITLRILKEKGIYQ